MWTIRQEQTDAFRQHHLQKFEDDMVEHSKEVAPVLCKLIGDEYVRPAVHRGIKQAQAYGFTNRGPIRLFIELKLLFGSSFDTDPQYPWASQILQAPGHEMSRAEELRGKTLEYQQKVSGPDAVNTYEALKKLSVLAKQKVPFSAEDCVSGMLREMARVFPQKASFVGERLLAVLVNRGMAEARRHEFSSPRGDLLVVSLMFAFGHGCINDPLYPWIARTLNDEKITTPAARAERLEKKSLTWLSHVLATPLEEHRHGA